MHKLLLLQKYNIFLFYNYFKILQKLNKFSIINNYLNLIKNFLIFKI